MEFEDQITILSPSLVPFLKDCGLGWPERPNVNREVQTLVECARV
jgi:hypothetical protein